MAVIEAQAIPRSPRSPAKSLASGYLHSVRILVTGGVGCIGSNFVRRALSGCYASWDGVEVSVLDELTYAGNLDNLAPVDDSPRPRFVRGDFTDRELVLELMADADQVTHLAAESHVDRSILGASDFVMTNVVGTEVLLDAALEQGIARFVHVSTVEVYGSIEEGSWTEDRPLAPNSPYSASKASSDLLALSCFHTHGLPVIVTRCSNNYGPYQVTEKVTPLATNLSEGETVPLYGDGLNSRDSRHVDDHCRGIESVRTQGWSPRRGLQHRRRHRTDQLRADSASARALRRRLGAGRTRGRPARARSPLQRGHHQDQHRARLCAAGLLRRGSGRDGAVVCRARGLVAAAASTRGTDCLTTGARIMSRWLVTGAGGMLGHDLCLAVRAAGYELSAATRAQFDITDARACQDVVDAHDVVVNAAAWTAVDDAETHQSRPSR